MPILPRLPLALLCVALAACGSEVPAPGSAPVGGAASLASAQLEAHFRAMVEAGKAQNLTAVQELVGALVPSRAELRSLLKSGPETQAWLQAYDGPTSETFKPQEVPEAGLSSPKRSEIFVHRATTEELAAYQKGSVAYREFPGGMRDFARTLALPGRTWWCVEAREPGKDDGTRFTAFTEVGGRFVLVVKPWRALRKTGGAAEEGAVVETSDPPK